MDTAYFCGFPHCFFGQPSLALVQPCLARHFSAHSAFGHSFLAQQHSHFGQQGLPAQHLSQVHFAQHFFPAHSALAQHFLAHSAFGHSDFGHSVFSHLPQQHPATTSAQSAPNTNSKLFFIFFRLCKTVFRARDPSRASTYLI